MALNEIASGLRGGLAFLTRLPIESRERDWLRFQEFPAAFPLVGYLVGAFVALPFLLLPDATAAFTYLLALVAVTGVAHLDGVADLGDAAVVHDGDGRRDVLKDTTVGVGAVSAVAVIVAGLALGGLALAGLPVWTAVALVVAAEVGAKFGMATVACIGTATHEGLGSQFTRNAEPSLLAGPALVVVPAALLTAPSPAALVAVLAGPVAAVSLVGWGERHIGGVNGDVFGAVNELARVAALHAGVVTWTYF